MSYRGTKISCYTGYITQAIINNLAPILFIIFQKDFGFSFSQLGSLVLINFGAQIATDIISAFTIEKMGYRLSAVLAHLFAWIGLAGLGILPFLFENHFAGMVIAIVIYAMGSGLIEVLISPVVEALPSDDKASSMSLLHSFYCWGQLLVVLVSTLFLKVFGMGTWKILPVMWAIIPFVNMFAFMRVPLPEMISEEEKTPYRKVFLSKNFAILCIMMLGAGAAELTMSQWASLFAEKGLGVSKVMGDLLGPCLFAFFMGLGRVIYGVKGDKINIKTGFVFTSVLCVVCYMVAAVSLNPFISLLGCALTGLSVSLMWPGTYSLGAETFPKAGTALFSILALFGDLGCSSGPYLAGVVSDMAQKSTKLCELGALYGMSADSIGLKLGIITAVIYPILMLIGVFLLKKTNTSKALKE